MIVAAETANAAVDDETREGSAERDLFGVTGEHARATVADGRAGRGTGAARAARRRRPASAGQAREPMKGDGGCGQASAAAREALQLCREAAEIDVRAELNVEAQGARAAFGARPERG